MPKHVLTSKALGDLARLARLAAAEHRIVVSIPTEDLMELVRVAQESLKSASSTRHVLNRAQPLTS